MILRRKQFVLMAMLAAGLSGGCAQIRDKQGYVMDETLVGSVQPGIDNRDSVLGSLGRPSFTGQFDQRDWYYVSRDTRNLGFNRPRPVAQTVLHIRFDESGNVVSVERSGLERVVSIAPMKGKTPTLGQNRGFFQELFGNIGAVGATGATTGTADNPK